MTFNFWKFKGGKSKRCNVCAIALPSFTAGSLITAHFAHTDRVRANSNRVFELRNLSRCTGVGLQQQVPLGPTAVICGALRPSGSNLHPRVFVRSC